MTRRPSQIVNRMTRQAFDNMNKRRNPGAEEREIVLRQFDQVEAEVHQSQNDKKAG
jgi:hypothetical protein